MEDRAIVEQLWQRDERALDAAAEKYGAYCRAIAGNLLGSREDAEECVNDAWHQAWLRIPPQRPENLGAWLGRVVRGIAMNLWNRNHAKKRGGGMELLLSELEDCVPGGTEPERVLEEAELGAALSCWLRSLLREERTLFVRRYWYGESLQDLAKSRGVSPAKLAQKMLRLRRRLRAALEKEGICL